MKAVRNVTICLAVVLCFWAGTLLADTQALNQKLLRIHVIGNSDSEDDQNVKLKVRDAVIESMRSEMANIKDFDTAYQYVEDSIPKLEHLANKVLVRAGFDYQADISLGNAAFDVRKYENMTLPAGIYKALCITLGEGEGKNWWCVAFPEVCFTNEEPKAEKMAVSAGFSQTLGDTIMDAENNQIRFFLLDALGQVKKFLFSK
jgi:stage II sporulation protein R